MNSISYDALLFSEFRMVAIDPGKEELIESNIIKAMTVNEELVSLGYTLTPAGIVTLARSSSLNDFITRSRP